MKELKAQLKKYYTTKQINELIKKIQGQRHWNEKWFMNRYVERVLFAILKTKQNETIRP